MNISEFYDLKVALFEDYRRGNLSKSEATEKLTELSKRAADAGLPTPLSAEEEIDLIKVDDKSPRLTEEEAYELESDDWGEDDSYEDEYEDSYESSYDDDE